MSRSVQFSPEAFEQYNEWAIGDRKAFRKLLALLRAVRRDPFEGVGKPEALKGDSQGLWSRRINAKDRLVYRVSNERIEVISCKGHYDDK